jgi:hypothetical protein
MLNPLWSGKFKIPLLIFLSAVFTVAAQAPRIPDPIPVSGDTEFVHDPSLIKAGDTWYVFLDRCRAEPRR